jgi:hypothetical protein
VHKYCFYAAAATSTTTTTINVKLSLCLIRHHEVCGSGGVCARLHIFLNFWLLPL